MRGAERAAGRATGRTTGWATGRTTVPAGGVRASGRGAAAALFLTASLALAGCSGSGGPSAAGDARSDTSAVAPSPAADGRQGGGAAARAGRPGAAPKLTPSQIIRTATLTVQTKDVTTALAKARAAVDGAGGYAADETTDRDPEGHDRSRIVLRVPPAEYDAVLGKLTGLGKLLSREVSAKDVTDQVVDVDSRIKTQRASVSRVRELMDKATTISDIVALESELNSREADLESLEAQLKSLKGRTGMATVTLLLRQPDAAAETDSGEHEPSFSEALSGGWHAFLTAVRWVLVAIGAVLPFAVTAGVLYALWRLVRDRLPAALRIRRRAGGKGGARQRTAPAPMAAPVAGQATAPVAAPVTGPAPGQATGQAVAPPADPADVTEEDDRGPR
ncbi:DUF4349 domain-containing protein [Streptomyces sp. NPDC048506]|uniref:DUF4349 domain-containing protein n=1 Tax=Streptomyces sp. NPDC048506 TaxID=3155028 RepID=UPI0034489D2B